MNLPGNTRWKGIVFKLAESTTLSAMVLVIAILSTSLASATAPTSGSTESASPNVIPWSKIGVAAGAQYSGGGLKVEKTEQGARLYCVFQRLDAEATREGLWLTSAVTNPAGDRFRVAAVAVGEKTLPRQGQVTVEGQIVRFSRPGLIEEYSVSMDGVRQDFMVLEKPIPSSGPTSGGLCLELGVTGARIESGEFSAELVLASGRKIAYSRLRVTDANGRELPANIEKTARSPLATTMTIVVDDVGASYPVRIDPTFSDANWVSMGGIPGADDAVFAAVVDGSGNLYIGGFFSAVGDVIARRIAKWDGSSWSALGSGMNQSVNALAVSGGHVYAGGAFTNAGGNAANYIARWDGNNWSALGSGMNSNVWTLTALGSDIYAGGDFTIVDGNAGKGIAKWNGSAWSVPGSGVSGVVRSLVVSGGDLYAGGLFNKAGEQWANCIAKWDGSSWSALGSGANNTVFALAVSGGNVYAGGGFTKAGDVDADGLAKWDGTNWSGIPGVHSVRALAVSGTNLYVGGFFEWAGLQKAKYIAKWDGSSWSALGSGMNGVVFALATSGNAVYASGTFTTAGGGEADYIAQWNGSTWGAVRSGIDGVSSVHDTDTAVYAVAVSGSDVYVGGSFASGEFVATGGKANYIAKWNGSGWSALGRGLNNIVRAIAVSGSDVYVGGEFWMATNSGGQSIPVNRIAKWDGNTWSPLSAGLSGGINPTVWALAASGSNVYAGGYFGSANGSPALYIARWNGLAWSAVGLGLNDRVYALAVSGSDVYAGGAFTMATNNGGVAVSANRIAKWDGNSWSSLGSGMNNNVYAIAISGSDVYGGGDFSQAGGSPVQRIAKWNGSVWTDLGGVNSTVFALAAANGSVYVGGTLTQAGNTSANRIAQWDGNSWSSLGSGVDGDEFPFSARVNALASRGSDVFAGGVFVNAGGKVSPRVAKWAPLAFRANSVTFANGTFQALLTGPDTNRVVVDSTTNFANWSPVITNTLPLGGAWQLSIPTGTNAHQFYRARLGP